MRFFNAFFDNDSVFGQIMTRLGILIAANVLFIIFSLPIVTIGASFTALYYVMLSMLRGETALNPLRTFWVGFRQNFKQATKYWLLTLVLFVVLYLEIFWCSQFTGAIATFRYPLMALAFALFILVSYLFPTLAAFHVTLRQLLADCVYFAFRRPITLIIVLFTNVMPMVLTYMDYPRLPLYAFLWCLCGFALVAFSNARLLIILYLPYLEERKEEATEEESQKEPPSQKQILDDMRKLDM